MSSKTTSKVVEIKADGGNKQRAAGEAKKNNKGDQDMPLEYCICGCYGSISRCPDSFHMAFKGGQKIFLASEHCLVKVSGAFFESMCQRWVELPKRRMRPERLGLSQPLLCPVTGNAIQVNDQLPKIMFVGGQCLFFNDYASVASFANKPIKYLLAPKKTIEFRSATCLCDKKLIISSETPSVHFKHGQRIYACSENCKNELLGSAQGDVLSEFVEHVPLTATPLPDMREMLVGCVRCGHVVVVKHSTPRIQLTNKQALYCCGFKCIEQMLRNLEVFQNAATNVTRIHQQCVVELQPEPPAAVTEVLGVQHEPLESADAENPTD